MSHHIGVILHLNESTFKDNLFCKIVNIPRLFTKSFASQFPLPGAKLGIVERWVVEEKTTNIHWIFQMSSLQSVSFN